MRGHESTAQHPLPTHPSPLTCEKPPRTIRLAGIPFFISCSIKALTGGRGHNRVGGKLLEGLQEGSQTRGSAQHFPGGPRGTGRMPRRGWGLTVLCCFLDASLVLWRIWTQPHQVKPGGVEALAATGRPGLAPGQLPRLLFPSPGSPGGHHHLHVECHRDPRPAKGQQGGPSCAGGMRQPQQTA